MRRVPVERILDELVFEKVRLGAQLCELLAFERDLDRSIFRALNQCDASAEAQRDLLGRCFERASARIRT
jgi:hypothetical protein